MVVVRFRVRASQCTLAATDSRCLAAGHDGQCVEIGLELAADALHSALGGSAKWIWGIGLLAAGQAATMTTTYAGQVQSHLSHAL